MNTPLFLFFVVLGGWVFLFVFCLGGGEVGRGVLGGGGGRYRGIEGKVGIVGGRCSGASGWGLKGEVGEWVGVKRLWQEGGGG